MHAMRLDPRLAWWHAMTGEQGSGHHGHHGHHGHGRHGHGRGPWRGGPWAFPGFPGGPGGFGRRPRMRRGDVRAALLVLLDEEPRNGYGLMQEIEHRSEGLWRPSPGSVYPALSQLEDEGLVRSRERDGRREFELTDEGRAHVEQHREELGAPWEAVSQGVGQGTVAVRDALRQVAVAAMQVVHAGDEAQVARAGEILVDARRALYRILAEEDEPGG